jgi:hypothetical protein
MIFLLTKPTILVSKGQPLARSSLERDISSSDSRQGSRP